VSAPPTLASLALAGSAAAWLALGFAVDGATCRVGSTQLRFEPGEGAITGWTLMGGGAGDVDGLPTSWIAAEQHTPPAPAIHPNGALQVDHVVVMTPDVGRTTSALETHGLRCRRVRDAQIGDAPVRQAFFRLGEALLEVVGPPARDGSGPASFWGLTIVVADLEDCARRLGTRLGTVRDAVQPGRRIATVRREAGVGVPLALMSPGR
jgi:catechol 2,3-dioxygenase-like lactoylglutathione lyase family enzyme